MEQNGNRLPNGTDVSAAPLVGGRRRIGGMITPVTAFGDVDVIGHRARSAALDVAGASAGPASGGRWRCDGVRRRIVAKRAAETVVAVTDSVTRPVTTTTPQRKTLEAAERDPT